MTRRLDDLPLWRVPPPSVPSGGSERGSDRARRFQRDQYGQILRALADGCVRSRDELHALTGIPVNALCGRLAPSGRLQTLGEIDVIEDGATSAAGIRVLGYRISEKGMKRIGEKR